MNRQNMNEHEAKVWGSKNLEGWGKATPPEGWYWTFLFDEQVLSSGSKTLSKVGCDFVLDASRYQQAMDVVGSSYEEINKLANDGVIIEAGLKDKTHTLLSTLFEMYDVLRESKLNKGDINA